jgi:hypothetical protein
MTEDYRAVAVPDGKDPASYSYRERRAELLDLIEEAGSPRLLNYAAYGREAEPRAGRAVRRGPERHSSRAGCSGRLQVHADSEGGFDG